MNEYILTIDWNTYEWLVLGVHDNQFIRGIGLGILTDYLSTIYGNVYVWGGLTYLYTDKLYQKTGTTNVINVRKKFKVSIDSLYQIIYGHNYEGNNALEENAKVMQIAIKIIKLFETS